MNEKTKNTIYDILKWLVITVLPALVIYLTNVLPVLGYDPTGPVTIVSATAAFIGSCIGISSINYSKKQKGPTVDESEAYEDI